MFKKDEAIINKGIFLINNLPLEELREPLWATTRAHREYWLLNSSSNRPRSISTLKEMKLHPIDEQNSTGSYQNKYKFFYELKN